MPLRRRLLPPVRAGAKTAPDQAALSGSLGLGFCHVGGDGIHQRGRQAVIGFEPEFLEPGPDPAHRPRLDPGLDHRGHECRKAGAAEPLSVNSSGWMKSARRTGAPCSRCGRTCGCRTPCRRGAGSPPRRRSHAACRRSPARFTLSRGTTATTENTAPSGFQHLVQPQAWLWATSPLMPTLTGLVLALAHQRAAGKAARTLLHSVVDRWVDMNSHRPLLLF